MATGNKINYTKQNQLYHEENFHEVNSKSSFEL